MEDSVPAHSSVVPRLPAVGQLMGAACQPPRRRAPLLGGNR
jgi:hypothetical protein